MTRKKVTIEIRLPTAMIDWIDAQGKAGLLGGSRDEVIEFVLRSQLVDWQLKASAGNKSEA